MEVSFLERPAAGRGADEMRRLPGHPPTTRVEKVVEKLRERESETGMCSGLGNQMEEKDGTPLRSVPVAQGPKKQVTRPGSSPNWPGSGHLATSTAGTLGAGAPRDAKPIHSRADRAGLKVNRRTEAG